MSNTVVLIDYENVQPEQLTELNHRHLIVYVFVGPRQSKVSFELAATLQRMGSKAEYIQASRSGSNALDFHIAFYMGLISAKQAGAKFLIVSKDTGFDPLIEHLRSKGISCRRVPDIVGAKQSPSQPRRAQAATKQGAAPERLSIIVRDLVRRGNSRPRSVKTLTSTIHALFQKKLPASEVPSLIRHLQANGTIAINGTTVTYRLPNERTKDRSPQTLPRQRAPGTPSSVAV